VRNETSRSDDRPPIRTPIFAVVNRPLGTMTLPRDE
jgi:hypothetical protein